MRFLVVPLLFAVCSASTCDGRPSDSAMRTHMSDEEMNAPASYHQVKAAILTDVRVWRELDKRLPEGRKVCAGIVMVDGEATCANDQELLEVYPLKNDLADQVHRVDESAYFCRKEGVYHYHYVGGPQKLDVWLGPYKLVRRTVKPDATELDRRH
jgi:hypothetical protein